MGNSVKQAQVVRLRPYPVAVGVLEDIIKGFEDGTIEDLVVIASEKIPKEKQKELNGAYYTIRKYWYGGDSCVKVLGLLEYMKMEVKEFILSRQYDYNDGGD